MNILTTRQVAEQLGTSPKVVLANAKKCLSGKIIQNGKPTYWTPEEVSVLIEQLKCNSPNGKPFPNLPVELKGLERCCRDSTITTNQFAKQLGTTVSVILENGRKCFPEKIIENGKPTYWTQKEVTVLLDYMKTHNSNNRSQELNLKVSTTTTELSPALKIKKALELMQEGYEEEMERLRTVNQTLVQENMKLEDEKAALLPRAEAYSQFLDRSQSINLRDAAQYLGVTQTELMSVLKTRYIYRARDGYRAYSEYSCYFMLRPWTNGDRSGQQLLMTSKGLDFFRGRLPQKIEDRTGGQDAE